MITESSSATTVLIAAICFGALSSYAIAQEAASDHEYIAPNRMFSTTVPKSPNWAGIPYRITALDTRGDKRYDKVMFHVDDFGQYLVAGARVVTAKGVSEMNKDEHRTVLRNLAEAALMGWRTDFTAPPETIQESFLDTKYGEAIVRVYHAKKGSILVSAQGRRPTRDDAFDTNISTLVARQGAIVVFVLAQNDSSPDDANLVVRMATELFQNLRVLADQ